MILDIHFQTPLLLNNFLFTKPENISLHPLRYKSILFDELPTFKYFYISELTISIV